MRDTHVREAVQRQASRDLSDPRDEDAKALFKASAGEIDFALSLHRGFKADPRRCLDELIDMLVTEPVNHGPMTEWARRTHKRLERQQRRQHQ